MKCKRWFFINSCTVHSNGKAIHLQQSNKEDARNRYLSPQSHMQFPNDPLRKQKYSKIGDDVDVPRRDDYHVIVEAFRAFDSWIPRPFSRVALEHDKERYRDIKSKYDGIYRVCPPPNYVLFWRRCEYSAVLYKNRGFEDQD